MKTKPKPRTLPRPRPARRASKPAPAPRPSVADTTPVRLKRILVTTDFSNESKTALPYAAALAERLGSEVHLLHILEAPPRFVGLESVALLSAGDAVMGRAYAVLDAMGSRAFKEGTRIITHARTGAPVDEIVRAVRDLDADFLIMATHGYTGLKHTFLGSTTERVMRQASCPVLAVRASMGNGADPAGKLPAIQRILLATDFSGNAAKAFPLAQALGTAFGARTTLLNVIAQFPVDATLAAELPPDTSARLMEEARQRLSDLSDSLRKESGFKTDPVVRFGTPYAEIVNEAKALQASLIVLATHGYGGLKRAYLGSVAERVVRHAHCPVLVVRQKTR